MEGILDTLRSLPKELTELIILCLLKEEVITYEDISKLYVKYINEVKNLADKKTSLIVGDLVNIAVDYKQNRSKNIKRALQRLDEYGMINMEKQKIENHR